MKEVRARIEDLTSKVAQWNAEALEGGSASLSKLIVQADAKADQLRTEAEALEQKLTVSKSDTLPATQSLITELMEKKTGKDLLDLRSKLKALLALSVKRITVEVRGTKSAGIVVELVNGNEVRTGEVCKVGKFTVALCS